MAATTTIQHVQPVSIHAGRRRALAVAAATVAAVAVWAIEAQLLGIHLATRFGSAAPQSVGIEAVVTSSLAASLAGWALLTILERRLASARAVWTVIAVVVLAASLSLPIAAGTTTAAKAGLALMHLTVAGVLIPVLRRG